MIVAQITDLHIKRRGHMLHHMPHVAGPLRRCLARIASLRELPSVIVATGDLTESGHPEEYRRLRELLEAAPVPVMLMPGNHDRRDAMREVFRDAEYLLASGEHVQFTYETQLARLIALDSTDSRRIGGFLDAARLDWLEARLHERPRIPTILALHHPPFLTGVPQFDRQEFYGRERLGSIVRANRQIRRIICGHVHQTLVRPWNGTIAVSAPSTAPTLVLHPSGGLYFEPGDALVHHYDWFADFSSELLSTALRRPAPDVQQHSAVDDDRGPGNVVAL